MADGPEDVQRWTAKRRVALVLSVVRGETSVAEAARKHGLTVAEIEDWQERLLAAAENALRARPKDEEALKDEQIKKLKQKVGELVRRSYVNWAGAALMRRTWSGSRRNRGRRGAWCDSG
jgi:transposase-like protein